MKFALRCLGLLLSVGLAACGGEGQPESAKGRDGGQAAARIEGQVYYRERMLLPPGAELEVQLQDISRPDALASVLASVLLTPEGGPPYAFVIDYDPAHINPRMRYALRATISVGGRLMFSSTEYIDPFGDPPLEVLVQRVPEPVQHSRPPQ